MARLDGILPFFFPRLTAPKSAELSPLSSLQTASSSLGMNQFTRFTLVPFLSF